MGVQTWVLYQVSKINIRHGLDSRPNGAYMHPMVMLRRSIGLTKEQRAFLEREAARLGITEADLIRRIIDHYRDVIVYKKGEPK